MTRIAILATVAGALLLPSLSNAATLESFRVDGWTVGAHSNKTGQFQHCAASIPYNSGVTLYFAVGSNFGWSMALSNTAWNLPANGRYTMTYSIDGSLKMRGLARVVHPRMIEIELANSEALFQRFRQGHVLNVESGNVRFDFSLRSSSVALSHTLECAKRYVASSAARPPPSPQPGPSDPGKHMPPADEAAQAEASVILANILSATGVQGFRVLPREEIPDQYKRWAAVWQAPGIVGGLALASYQQGEVVALELTQTDALTCKGAFASERLPAEGGLTRLRTGCSQGERFLESAYTITPRAKGGFYIFGVAAEKGKFDSGRETAERVFQTILKSPPR